MANGNGQGQVARKKKPSQFSPGKQKKYLELLASGHRRLASARAAGSNRETVRKLMNRSKSFREKVEQAEMVANEVVEDRMYRGAIEGHFGKQVFWLCNRDPERWKDVKRLELTGADGGPVGLEAMLEDLDVDRKKVLKEIAAERMERRAGSSG